jgi:hypothetical protein
MDRTPHKELVTIHVTNADGKVFDFVVHKSFLCHASPFFDAAFNGNFVEGQTQSMNLETSEQAFGMLVEVSLCHKAMHEFCFSGCCVTLTPEQADQMDLVRLYRLQ